MIGHAVKREHQLRVLTAISPDFASDMQLDDREQVSRSARFLLIERYQRLRSHIIKNLEFCDKKKA